MAHYRDSVRLTTYGNLLLREHNSTILPPNADRGDVGRGDGLECIF